MAEGSDNKKVRFNCPSCKWHGQRGPTLKKCPECGEPVKRSAHRPGRGQKARQRAKKAAADALAQTHGEVWGLGGDHQDRQDNRLVRQSLRWKTDASAADLGNLDPASMRAKEIAMLVTRRNMLNTDPTISNNAVRNLVSMEAQNQRDDQGREPSQHLHLHSSPQNNPYLNAPIETIVQAKLALARLEEEGTPIHPELPSDGHGRE